MINYVLIEKLITICQIESWSGPGLGSSCHQEVGVVSVVRHNHRVDNQAGVGEIIRAV